MHETRYDALDIAIVVALAEEFQEFLALAPEPVEKIPNEEYGGYYYRFNVGTPSLSYKCVACFVGNMGPEQSALTTDRIIRRWQPSLVAMLGIAAGLHPDIRLGDVIVAEQVDVYLAETKARPQGKGSWKFSHRGRVFQGDHALLQEIANLPFAHPAIFSTWVNTASRELSQEIPSKDRRLLIKQGLLRQKSRLTHVHLASGPVVGAARAFAEWLKVRDESIKALDMEAAGLAMAAMTRATPVRTLVIRGVSDLGDERKAMLDAVGTGGLRRLAMRNATRLLFTLLNAGLVTGRSASKAPPAHITVRSSADPNSPAGNSPLIEGGSVSLERWVNPIDGTVLILIPASSFRMGNSARRLADHGYSPNPSAPTEWEPHVVHLSSFWIARTPITNLQYSSFCQATSHPLPPRMDDQAFNGDDHPVISISWYDAEAYLKWAHLDFPSEAQWERAAAGVCSSFFPWSDDPPSHENGNFNRANPGTTAVSRYVRGASVDDVLDLFGNVLEWCRDDTRVFQPTDITDPLGFLDSPYAAIRGGSFARLANQCRASYRDRRLKNACWGSTGLRPALAADPRTSQ